MHITIVRHVLAMFTAGLVLALAHVVHADSGAVPDGASLKKIVTADDAGQNLLIRGNWRPWQKGFERDNGVFICDNASDAQVQRGLSQTVTLNQTSPEPIVATAWSKADTVGGSRGSDYALYLDLVYSDGEPRSRWAQWSTPGQSRSHCLWRSLSLSHLPRPLRCGRTTSATGHAPSFRNRSALRPSNGPPAASGEDHADLRTTPRPAHCADKARR